MYNKAIYNNYNIYCNNKYNLSYRCMIITYMRYDCVASYNHMKYIYEMYPSCFPMRHLRQTTLNLWVVNEICETKNLLTI